MSINLAEFQAEKSFQYGYQTALEKFASQISGILLKKEASLSQATRALSGSNSSKLKNLAAATNKISKRGGNVSASLKNSRSKVKDPLQASAMRLLEASASEGGLQGAVKANNAAKAAAKRMAG